MQADPTVLAVVVNWNGGAILRESVDSLLSSDYGRLAIWVVDNGSTDDSMTGLPASITQLLCTRNLGYSGAINHAVESAFAGTRPACPPDYFLILNNDLRVEPETVSQLISFSLRSGSRIVGPQVLNSQQDKLLEAAWGAVTWSHVLCRFYGKGAQVGPRWITDQPVEVLLGSALLIHRSVFEQVGRFDEQYFMYHEEVDFLYRANQRGIPAHFCSTASVIHRGGYSTRSKPSKKVYWVRRNAALFLRKHQAKPLQWAYYWITLSSSILFNLLLLRWQRIRTILSAVGEGLNIEIEEPGGFLKRSAGNGDNN